MTIQERRQAATAILFLGVGGPILWSWLGPVRFAQFGRYADWIASVVTVFLLLRLRVLVRADRKDVAQSREAVRRVASVRQCLLELADDQPPYHEELTLDELCAACTDKEIDEIVVLLKGQAPGHRSLRKAVEIVEKRKA
jgi:hypothetical protein